MAYQIIAVNDASPGACVDVGMTWNGTTTLTATQIIAGTSFTASETLDVTGNSTFGGTVGITGNVAVNTDKFNITAASGNTAIAGTLGVAGIASFAEAAAFGGVEESAMNGAETMPVDTIFSGYTTNSTADIDATLADGTVGQIKFIRLTTKDTNNLVVTPAHFNDGSTLTFDATGEYAILLFIGTGWTMLAGTATVGA